MDQGRQIVIGSFSWISVIKIIDRLTRWVKVDSGGINITVKIIEIQVLHEVNELSWYDCIIRFLSRFITGINPLQYYYRHQWVYTVSQLPTCYL